MQSIDFEDDVPSRMHCWNVETAAAVGDAIEGGCKAKDYRIPKTCHSCSFEWGKMQRLIWPLNRRKPRLLNERANR